MSLMRNGFTGVSSQFHERLLCGLRAKCAGIRAFCNWATRRAQGVAEPPRLAFRASRRVPRPGNSRRQNSAYLRTGAFVLALSVEISR